jgi:hypothetical protein
MIQSFGVNSAQANKEFEAVATALTKLQSDYITKGMGDRALETASSNRAAQNGVKRSPWIMSTTEWLMGNPPRGLAWEVNPGDISWTMGQRSIHTKTIIGTVLHVWPNVTRSTFFDEPRITLNLQSGNIMPVVLKNGTFEPAGGMVNFYDFMMLVDAPKLTVGTAGQPPRTNLVSIQYSSNLFPKITLLGMFDPSGIKFTDTSQDNQVNGWSADFIIYDTIPKLSTFNGQQTNPLINMWQTVLGLDTASTVRSAERFSNIA